ncbi:Rtt106-domain-containing protein [Piedraia hortae CBS 480.64]|uniref:Rtt106-domain-containing protein n=1 Tax=Piedraia hortae CBS 480.64 TaxID=1314780 RepID=A0A6A7CAC5_9PEZI|nr:Rtt106-domain-containing protein [Piedraia hortae CBS 480.64]
MESYPASLQPKINEAIASHPNPAHLKALFIEIGAYIPSDNGNNGDVSSKKRKFAHADDAKAIISPVTVWQSAEAVSVVAPMRKKLQVAVVMNAAQTKREVRLHDPKNTDSESAEYILSDSEIQEIFCLPVPEKQAKQSNFVIVPTQAAERREAIVFTVADTPSKGDTAGETEATLTRTALETHLRRKVQLPSEKEFTSGSRKGEREFHIKANRGSKDGYIFLLTTGILFAYKKPVLYFPLNHIQSVGYTNVLSYTFNLVLTVLDPNGSGEDGKEIEFSMLDQSLYPAVDKYVKSHGLNDSSLAEQRKAKLYNVNNPSAGKDAAHHAEGGGEVDEDDTQTALPRTEQQIQDEEDEMEEDYEASGGESDGEGASSEEAEAMDGHDGYDDDDDDDDDADDE